MCYHRLEDAARAREYFERARESHQRNAARLTKDYAEELQQFRTEAEALLGPEKSRRTAPPDRSP
jgi:hypothetical protein